MLENIKCPICNSNNNVGYLKVSDRFNSTNANDLYSLVKCKCDFVFLNPRPKESEMVKFYLNELYNPHSNDSNYIINCLYKTIQSFAFIWKKKIIKSFIHSGTLLDIGGGRGEFCDYMLKSGYNSTLYEPNVNAIDKSNCKNKTNSLTDLNSTYDVITLWHSLEHIHKLNFTLENISKLLSETGIVVIAVPNIYAYELKYLKENWVAFDAPRHLYHFSIKTLKTLLEKYDLEITSTHRIPQDTPYNILLSFKGNIIRNIFKLCWVTVLSLAASFYNKNNTSSILCVCKRK